MARSFIDMAEHLGRPLNASLREIDLAVRFVREAGLIPLGKPGPGGGPPPATAEHLANLIIGFLATDAKRDAGLESGLYGTLLPSGRKRCALTRAICFAHALKQILDRPELAAAVENIAVSRSHRGARITYRKDGEIHEQLFGKFPPKHLRIEAILHGDSCRDLADILARAVSGDLRIL